MPQVKAKIVAERGGPDPERMILNYGTAVLENRRTLSDYNITPLSNKIVRVFLSWEDDGAEDDEEDDDDDDDADEIVDRLTMALRK